MKERLREFDLKTTEPFAVLLTACGEKETAGLRELVERYNVRIVAAPDGVELVRKICATDSTILASNDIENQGWFSVTTIPLKGLGIAPVAYLLRWEDKSVLISGRIPIEVDQQSREELLSWLKRSKHNATDYLKSIQRLADIHPSLWLPAVPIDGRNANLQVGEWNAILEKNFVAIRPLWEGQ